MTATTPIPGAQAGGDLLSADRAIHGSTAARIIHTCPVPVLVRTRRREHLMDLTVRDRAADATRPSVVTPPEATLRAVARRLWEESVGAAAVVDEEDRVIGILSERDIVAQLAHGGDPDATTAEDAMTRTVVSARPDDRLLDVVFVMTDAAVRHVPVIDEHGEMSGMVSIRDMVRPLLVANLGG